MLALLQCPTGKGALTGRLRYSGRQEKPGLPRGVASMSEPARGLAGRDGSRKEGPEALLPRGDGADTPFARGQRNVIELRVRATSPKRSVDLYHLGL